MQIYDACIYLLGFDYLARSFIPVGGSLCLSFGRSIAIMPYYKLVARTSGPVKCNALSNGFTRDVLSLIVHRRGTLGIIFAVLLVTGGSEQVALASA